MKIAAFILALTCSALLAVSAQAQQTQSDNGPTINNNESSLKGATPSDFLSQAQQDKKNAQKAKNYISAEYYRSKKIASYVILLDACVQGGLLPPETVSLETKYNLFVDREKARPDPNRPPNLVQDDDIAASMRKALEDARKKFQNAKAIRDETHCHNFATLWAPLAKKSGFDESSDVGSSKP